MDYGLTLCRDTLVLDEKLGAQLGQRLGAAQVPGGAPVLIAARELRVTGDFSCSHTTWCCWPMSSTAARAR